MLLSAASENKLTNSESKRIVFLFSSWPLPLNLMTWVQCQCRGDWSQMNANRNSINKREGERLNRIRCKTDWANVDTEVITCLDRTRMCIVCKWQTPITIGRFRLTLRCKLYLHCSLRRYFTIRMNQNKYIAHSITSRIGSVDVKWDAFCHESTTQNRFQWYLTL